MKNHGNQFYPGMQMDSISSIRALYYVARVVGWFH